MKEMLNSTLPNEVQKRIQDGLGFGWAMEMTIDTMTDFLQASAKFLATKQNKDKPVALELRDINGGFHFATIVQFIPQEEAGADDGSWALSFTFEETDIDKNWEVFDINESPEAKTVFYDVSYAKHGISWRFRELDNTDKIAEGTPIQILCVIVDAIRDYMVLNATMDPDLAMGDVVTFHAELAQDKVYIGVTPGILLKQMVKADAAIGKVAA
jgi:hypothetical protein